MKVAKLLRFSLTETRTAGYTDLRRKGRGPALSLTKKATYLAIEFTNDRTKFERNQESSDVQADSTNLIYCSRRGRRLGPGANAENRSAGRAGSTCRSLLRKR